MYFNNSTGFAIKLKGRLTRARRCTAVPNIKEDYSPIDDSPLLLKVLHRSSPTVLRSVYDTLSSYDR